MKWAVAGRAIFPRGFLSPILCMKCHLSAAQKLPVLPVSVRHLSRNLPIPVTDSSSVGIAPPAPNFTYDNQVCLICLTNPKDMAFGCWHQTCCECGQDLQSCPICRSAIQTWIKLY